MSLQLSVFVIQAMDGLILLRLWRFALVDVLWWPGPGKKTGTWWRYWGIYTPEYITLNGHCWQSGLVWHSPRIRLCYLLGGHSSPGPAADRFLVNFCPIVLNWQFPYVSGSSCSLPWLGTAVTLILLVLGEHEPQGGAVGADGLQPRSSSFFHPQPPKAAVKKWSSLVPRNLQCLVIYSNLQLLELAFYYIIVFYVHILLGILLKTTKITIHV